MKVFNLFLVIFTFIFCTTVQAQEFDCSVRVQAPRLQQVDPAAIQTLETSIFEFMNNRIWTDLEYTEEERIECDINITITEDVTLSRFKAEATIQSSRPVYNSTYKSVAFKHQDNDWDFDYAQYEALNFNENAYSLEITSLLGFYAYILLGFDADSFEMGGGSKWFDQARQISQIATEGNRKGWKAFDGTRNRYWLVDNQLSPKFTGLRQAYYSYHRDGLDGMAADMNAARKAMVSAIELVGTTAKANPNSMGMAVFSNTKSDEIYDIFNNAIVPGGDKTKIGNTMVRLDPANAQKFLSMGKSGGKSSQVVPSRGK